MSSLSRAPNKDTVFEALKSSLDSLPEGVKMILNGGMGRFLYIAWFISDHHHIY